MPKSFIRRSTGWAIQNNQWRDILHAYLACVSFADHQVGKVLEALDASPYKDNTIVVLWSDHGYHMGEKNTFQKNTLWERSSRAPLIIDERSIFWHYSLYLQGKGLTINVPGGKTYSWRGFPSTSLRRGDWKLIEFHEDDTVGLYHLKNDPGEENNLA